MLVFDDVSVLKSGLVRSFAPFGRQPDHDRLQKF